MDESMDNGPGVLAQQAQQAQGSGVDPRMMEAFKLVVARVREALAKVGADLDAALRADPVSGAVQFGTNALREVARAAEKAGRALPFEVIAAAGMQTIKDLAVIANEKGYLPDEQVEVFMKEVMQQSLGAYVQMDADAGLISEDDRAAVAAKLGESAQEVA